MKFTKEYKRLVNRVRAIDPAASCWMMNHAPKIKTPNDFEPHGRLYACFVWYFTPQGHEYWSHISERLGE
jgi:hypothetical protein